MQQHKSCHYLHNADVYFPACDEVGNTTVGLLLLIACKNMSQEQTTAFCTPVQHKLAAFCKHEGAVAKSLSSPGLFPAQQVVSSCLDA